MMIVNWNIESGRLLLLILLLSGDIHLNPGPSATFPCRTCRREVLASDPAIQCDQCDMWVQVTCDCSLTISDYNEMLANPSDDPWFCSACRLTSHQVPTTGLSCVCFNARSIIAKRLDFIAFICAHLFDVVSVTETFLDQTIPDALVVLDGYTVFHRDRNRHSGGLLVLVKTSLTSSCRRDLESDCEMLWLELLTSGGKVNLVTFYRPPDSSVDSLQQLMTSISFATSSSLPLILCGDFNVPEIDWSLTVPSMSSPAAIVLHNFIQDHSLSQLVCYPTHGDHILDLLLTNEPDFVSSISVGASLHGCEHDAVYFTMLTTLPPQTPRNRLLLKYKDVNLDYLNEVFSHVPWDVIDFDADIDQCWLQCKDLFLAAIYQVIPSVKWSKQKLKDWFSHPTIELIHKKRRLYRAYKSNPTSTLHEKYKKISNVVRKCSRNDTIKHSISVSGDYHSNPKRFWHWINSVKGSDHQFLYCLMLGAMLLVTLTRQGF